MCRRHHVQRLRNSGARPGDVVAVLGLGGLGHLGVQYAAKMGFHTVGIARGSRTRSRSPASSARGLHRQPGQDPAAELPKLGGAKVILATVTSGEAMGAVRAAWPSTARCWSSGRPTIEVSPVLLLTGCRSVKGWYSGTSIDSQDTLAFSVADRRALDERSLPAGARPKPTTA